VYFETKEVRGDVDMRLCTYFKFGDFSITSRTSRLTFPWYLVYWAFFHVAGTLLAKCSIA